MDLGLHGKKAIVCGSSAGLGSACARSLAREGCEVLIVARSSDRVQAVVEGLRSAGHSAKGVAASW